MHTHLSYAEKSSFPLMLIVLLTLIALPCLVIYIYRRKRLIRLGKQQSVLDRAGFKPLRTDDPESTDDESEDDTIIARQKSDHRFEPLQFIMWFTSDAVPTTLTVAADHWSAGERLDLHLTSSYSCAVKLFMKLLFITRALFLRLSHIDVKAITCIDPLLSQCEEPSHKKVQNIKSYKKMVARILQNTRKHARHVRDAK
ncbi:unnamed protein product [Gongylonema pulchrum]|uniref:Uncharacterized protein n=1 Tax=Gongylonema pulchrum TaxID=637853 RepID=A0A3P7P1R1_9BILA|nr:unnamed protein product [Gongylonema pulchrum]